jgi:hypothetical protein
MKNSFFKFIIFIIVFASSKILSQEVSITDTSVQRGLIHRIPINLVSEQNYSSIRLRIDYNAYLIDIKSLKGGSDFIAVNESPFFEKNQEDLENSFIIVKPLEIDPSNSVLCEIEFEALAGPDSVAFFIPTVLILDENETNANFESGRISIGAPVFPTERNTISEAYPNPANWQVKFDIIITEETNLKLDIYEMGGRKIYEYPGEMDPQFVLIEKETGAPVNIDENGQINEGNYTLQINFINWKWSTKIYFVVADIGGKKFRRKFLILK